MNLEEAIKKCGLKPSGILHVGAGMLEEADLYSRLGIETVVWVEALPQSELRSERARHFKHMLYERLALSDYDGAGVLRVASNAVSSSILPFWRHSVIYPDIVVEKELPVRTRRADTFFDGKFPPEIDVLVTDCQGADFLVIKGMGKLLNQIKAVLSEVMLTELYQGQALKTEMENWMAGQGFTHCCFHEVHKGEWGDELFWR